MNLEEDEQIDQKARLNKTLLDRVTQALSKVVGAQEARLLMASVRQRLERENRIDSSSSDERLHDE